MKKIWVDKLIKNKSAIPEKCLKTAIEHSKVGNLDLSARTVASIYAFLCFTAVMRYFTDRSCTSFSLFIYCFGHVEKESTKVK